MQNKRDGRYCYTLSEKDPNIYYLKELLNHLGYVFKVEISMTYLWF